MNGTLRSFLIALFATAASIGTTPALTRSDEHRTHRGDDRAVGLVAQVRGSTHAFRDVSMASAAGYGPFLGCVSGSQQGAMGVHYVNGALVDDGLLDAAQPEILVYEPQRNGGMRLVAVEYIVLADAWHASNPAPPTLSGQVFHYTGSPNRYGLPPFYALHVWAWKTNPSGVFVDWNPKVTCEHYDPEP